jgi:hypothetical protein
VDEGVEDGVLVGVRVGDNISVSAGAGDEVLVGARVGDDVSAGVVVGDDVLVGATARRVRVPVGVGVTVRARTVRSPGIDCAPGGLNTRNSAAEHKRRSAIHNPIMAPVFLSEPLLPVLAFILIFLWAMAMLGQGSRVPPVNERGETGRPVYGVPATQSILTKSAFIHIQGSTHPRRLSGHSLLFSLTTSLPRRSDSSK